MEQLDIFGAMREKYKIKKPIRLIELFAGIGSQAKALKNIGANFTHYKVVEFDKYALASYNAVHNTNFETQDITLTSAEDLEIVETDKYDYIMTYSFPCQDLSLAGKGAGMEKGTNTRSGLLWEVERLLGDCDELPQILLMENVPQVIGKKNLKDFRKWELKLESLGYSNYFKNLNAKDYDIPQNRNRTFMISVLGDYYYEFPKKQKLKLRLRDLLEDEVDEKYYLSDKMISFFQQNSKVNEEKGNGFRFKPFENTDIVAKTITTNNGNRMDDNFIIVPEATKQGYSIAEDGDGIYLDRPHQKRGVVQKGMIQTIKTQNGDVGVVDNLRIRKLTPKETWRLMGFTDEDFEKAQKVNSDTQLYKQAGNSIVVQVLEAIFKELL